MVLGCSIAMGSLGFIHTPCSAPSWLHAFVRASGVGCSPWAEPHNMNNCMTLASRTEIRTTRFFPFHYLARSTELHMGCTATSQSQNSQLSWNSIMEFFGTVHTFISLYNLLPLPKWCPLTQSMCGTAFAFEVGERPCHCLHTPVEVSMMYIHTDDTVYDICFFCQSTSNNPQVNIIAQRIR
jgi:hypothetical protein